MNIRQALYQNLSESTIVDSYYAKIMVKGYQKTYIPVDFRLKKGKISIPLKETDIYFDYKIKTESSNVCKGEYVLTKYYPIGTILSIEDMKLQINSYGEPTSVAGRTRVPIYTKCLNQDESNLIEVITNKTVEDRVKREMESILISNDIIKHKLPYYKYDWLDYTEENISSYDECVSLKKLFDIKFMESREYEYRLNEMNIGLIPGEYKTFSERYQKFLKRMNYEKMRIKYNRGSIVFNLISIAKWILFNREFKRGRLYLLNAYNDFCRLEIHRGSRNSIIVTIRTPDCAFYDYRIELINVVKCNINRAYFEYVMDNIKVFTLTKDCCTSETELINLTGEGSTNISKNIRRLKPSIICCPYTPWSCINNCPPSNCNSTKPGHCINQCCPGDQSDQDDNTGNCPSDDESVTIQEGDFNDTFFRIFVELLRHICASCCIVKESGATCKDEYYGLLNNMLIELINKFKEEIGEEGTYANTAEEFLAKYCDILSETNESIQIEDKDRVIEALDEFDHLPEDEQNKIISEKTKLEDFLYIIERLELGEDAKSIKRTFITVDTIEMRDAIPEDQLINGRLVRVNDNGHGEVAYYEYDAASKSWVEEDFVGDDIDQIVNNIEDHIYWNELTMEGV